MSNQHTISDEQLALEYQQGNEFSLGDLFKRYENYLKIRASQDHIKYPTVDEDDFHTHYVAQFAKAVQNFEVNAGKPFKYWLKVRLAKIQFDVVRSQTLRSVKDENGRYKEKEVLKTVSFEELQERNSEDHGGASYYTAQEQEDKSASYEVQMDETKTDLFAYIESKSPIDAKIAVLLTQGYTYREIGEMVNKSKSSVERSVGRLRDYATEYQKS
jgi:RNA polymerase sigma factor (sigma-70 family)